MLVSILLSFFYTVFFLLLIQRLSFFKNNIVSVKYIQLAFLLKIGFGVLLIEIYSFFYTDRTTADAFKYFDDARVIYDALFIHPSHYFRMVFGIHTDANDLFPYYQKMYSWYLSDDYTVYNDSRSVIRFNALVYPFSFGRHIVHMIFMCFISLCGLMALFKVFSQSFHKAWMSLYLAVFLVPSVLFWGSGVLKEGLILFAVGYLVYYFFQLIQNPFKLKYAIFFLLFFLLLVAVKFHVLVSLIPGFIIVFWQHKSANTNIFWKAAMTMILLFLLSIGVSLTSFKHSPFRMLVEKQEDFINLAKGGYYFQNHKYNPDTFYVPQKNANWLLQSNDSEKWSFREGLQFYAWKNKNITDTLLVPASDSSSYRLIMQLDSAGSKIQIAKIKPTAWSVLSNVPQSLFNVFFRPLIFESNNLLSMMAGFENLMFFVFLLLSIVFFKMPRKHEQIIFVFCASFVLILFSIIGMTTPVLGAIVRYKIPALPFLCVLFMFMIDAEKLDKRFPFVTKLKSYIIDFIGIKSSGEMKDGSKTIK